MTRLIALASVALWASGCGARSEGAPPNGPRRPVILELFTSEGCSSCPRADALLVELASEQPYAGLELIPLSFHVDYWDRLGWKDPFSSPAFTKRQRDYAEILDSGGRIYTPQLVIDGRTGIVGSDRRGLTRALERLTEHPVAPVAIERVGSRIDVRVGPAPLKPEDFAVLVAVTESGLSTDVPRGENAGRRLSHTGVVRAFRLAEPSGVSSDAASAQASVEIDFDPAWKRSNTRIVAWAQARSDGRVLGAASIPADRDELSVGSQEE